MTGRAKSRTGIDAEVFEMIDELKARELAQEKITLDDVALGEARELQEGWFFSWRTARIGCNGMIVNKRTGRVFQLGSAFPIERDLALYDRGYQFERYDLVILSIRDLDATRRAVGRLPLQVVEPKYEHGQVWRVPKTMTDLQRWKLLEKLPCILPALRLYFHLEVLEEVRREGWFEFEALEFRPTSISE
jgi:hypothetical protein